MSSITKNSSFYRTKNPGVPDINDKQNVIRRRFIIFKTIQEKLASNDPKIDKSMFDLNPNAVFWPGLIFTGTAALIAKFAYKRNSALVLIGMGLSTFYFFNLSHMIYNSQMNQFVMDNYHHFSPKFRKVLELNDYRYAAHELPEGISDELAERIYGALH